MHQKSNETQTPKEYPKPSESTSIKACMSCASMLITPCNLKRHAMKTYMCEDCGWIGGAAAYKSEFDRQKYIAQKKNGRQ